MEIKLSPEKCRTKEMTHAYLKEILRFPDYYGENLDALYDCLCDISKKTKITVPKIIGTEKFLGGYGKTMISVFQDAESENPYLRVYIE